MLLRLLVPRGDRERRKFMADNILLMPASRATTLDADTAQACIELLALTIGFLDKQIERAEELLGSASIARRNSCTRSAMSLIN
jgi:hypothetical protein